VTEATFEERLEAFEARLNARLTEAEERSTKLERERDEYKKLALLLQEQGERLKLGLLGQKAERLPKNDAQLSPASGVPARIRADDPCPSTAKTGQKAAARSAPARRDRNLAD
jgi:hypothetical protein